MNGITKVILSLAILLGISSNVSARVSLNGLVYWDEWIIAPTAWGNVAYMYRSNNTFEGMYGKGWCGVAHVVAKTTGMLAHIYLEQEIETRGQQLVFKACGGSQAKGPETIFEPNEKSLKLLGKDSIKDFIRRKLKSGIELEFQLSNDSKSKSVASLDSKGFKQIYKGVTTEYDLSGVLVRVGDLTIKRGKDRKIIALDVADDVSDELKRDSNVAFKYDAQGRVASLFIAEDNQATFSYNKAGLMKDTKNAWTNTYTMNYDDQGRLDSARWPDGSQVSLFYDPATGRLVSFLSRNGTIETYRVIDGQTNHQFRVLVNVTKDGEYLGETDALYWHRPDGTLEKEVIKVRDKSREWTQVEEDYTAPKD